MYSWRLAHAQMRADLSDLRAAGRSDGLMGKVAGLCVAARVHVQGRDRFHFGPGSTSLARRATRSAVGILCPLILPFDSARDPSCLAVPAEFMAGSAPINDSPHGQADSTW
jgi:hypothetical protein